MELLIETSPSPSPATADFELQMKYSIKDVILDSINVLYFGRISKS